MKPEDRYFLLYGLSVCVLLIVISYGVTNRPEIMLEDDQDVSGIIIQRGGRSVWLRLTSDDPMNNLTKGELIQYNITNWNETDAKSGDYIDATVIGEHAIIIEDIVPFFIQEHDRGFVNVGDLILVSGGKIEWDLSDPYPTFDIKVRNLGEKDIIGVRATINGVQLPYTFEVTKRNRIEPSQNLYTNRYTAWWDPTTNTTEGFIPVEGETYTVDFLIKTQGRSYVEYSFTDTYEPVNYGSISTLSGNDLVYFQGGDLLSNGLWNGGSIYVTFRNSWWVDGAQTIDRLTIFVHDKVVLDADVNIQLSEYVSIGTSFGNDFEIGETYDVTLRATSTSGNISEYTKEVVCEYYLIR